MSISAHLIEQVEAEADASRQVIERIPSETLDWRPHAKSWTLLELASHIANLVSWGSMIATTDGLDFSSPEMQNWSPPKPESIEEVLELLRKNTDDLVAVLSGASDEAMLSPWVMRNGDQVISSDSRAFSIGRWIVSHQSHHRGEMMMDLRLNDVPLPPIFGPTADEGQM
jgi:uncharacterized damage-inducible protein DinB